VLAFDISDVRNWSRLVAIHIRWCSLLDYHAYSRQAERAVLHAREGNKVFLRGADPWDPMSDRVGVVCRMTLVR
jgi:hypothetical protein